MPLWAEMETKNNEILPLDNLRAIILRFNYTILEVK